MAFVCVCEESLVFAIFSMKCGKQFLWVLGTCFPLRWYLVSTESSHFWSSCLWIHLLSCGIILKMWPSIPDFSGHLGYLCWWFCLVFAPVMLGNDLFFPSTSLWKEHEESRIHIALWTRRMFHFPSKPSKQSWMWLSKSQRYGASKKNYILLSASFLQEIY